MISQETYDNSQRSIEDQGWINNIYLGDVEWKNGKRVNPQGDFHTNIPKIYMKQIINKIKLVAIMV